MKTHKTAAANEYLEELKVQRIKILGTRQDIGPHEAVLQEVQETAGEVQWLRWMIQDILCVDPDALDAMPDAIGQNLTLHQWTKEGIKPSVWIDHYYRSREHLVRTCQAAVKMGVAERQVRIAEEQAKLFSMAMQAIFRDPRLQLTNAQKAALPTVAREHLTAIEATSRPLMDQVQPSKKSPIDK